MKQARHHIKNPGSVRHLPARPAVGSPLDAAAAPLSLPRLLASVGDGMDEDAIEIWTEVLRPPRHAPLASA